jgi:superfamily II DNA or RNA helicase
MMTPSELWAVAARPPRKWHADAIPKLLPMIREGRRGIVYAATGSGKSYAQGAILRAGTPDARFVDVVTVPTEALVEQMADDLAPWGIRAGRYYGRRKEVRDRAVIVCCLPSVGALAEDLALHGKRVRLVLADEAHRVTPGALDVLEPWRVMGWSATPIRTQGKEELRKMWPDGILYGYGMADAIADGAIVPPHIVPWTDPDTTEPNEVTLRMLRAHAEGPTVIDALDVADAHWHAGWLTEQGWASVGIDGTDAKTERARKLADLRDGRSSLVHVKLLTEGVDLPWLGTLAMRAQTKSVIRYVQQMGRVLRTYPGKTRGVVLDVHDAWGTFGLPRFSADMWGEAAEAAEEAMEREAGAAKEGERLISEAAVVVELEQWMARVRTALLTSGVIASERIRGSGWRRESVTGRQREVIGRWTDGRKSPARYLPADVRDRMAKLIASPDYLSRGGAADMLDVGIGLQGVARQYKERTGRWWGGLPALEVG